MDFLDECYKEEERLHLKYQTVHKLIKYYQMENKIQEVKDEAANKHSLRDFEYALFAFVDLDKKDRDRLNAIIDDAIKLYHQRLCEEAGRELPNSASIKQFIKDSEYNNDSLPQSMEVSKWIVGICSTLLAAKQGEIEGLAVDASYWQVQAGILKSQLEAKDKEIEVLKKGCDERSNFAMELTFKLTEAKAEVERLNKYIISLKSFPDAD